LLLSAGAELGADGLIVRKTIGEGIAVFCQVDPDGFNADQKTYFRYTRWRSTRAVAQLLANLGAKFAVDSRFFQPLAPVVNPNRMWLAPDGDQAGHDSNPPPPHDLVEPASAKVGYYCLDYRTDFPMGDNPYRYYRY
jgi:beta-galactosidase